MKTETIVYLVVCFLFASSCSNDDSPVPEEPNVHIAMTSQMTSSVVAQHWQDGTVTTLPSTTANTVNLGLYIDNSDVYMVGYESGASGITAAYWKNGTETSLPGTNATTSDIVVSNNDVYVCGRTSNGSTAVACYWKNSTLTTLSDGLSDAFANGIAVSGSNTYVVGYEFKGSHYRAKLWKNGVATDLTDGSHDGLAYKVAVSGSDVYAVGTEYSGTHYIAKLWKNGLATNLTDGTHDARANCIYIEDGDIYVAGVSNGKPVYWVNGTRHELPFTAGNTSENVVDIFVYKGDIYACGNTDDGSKQIAKYWKNEESEVIGLDNSLGSSAFGIFVR